MIDKKEKINIMTANCRLRPLQVFKNGILITVFKSKEIFDLNCFIGFDGSFFLGKKFPLKEKRNNKKPETKKFRASLRLQSRSNNLKFSRGENRGQIHVENRREERSVRRNAERGSISTLLYESA